MKPEGDGEPLFEDFPCLVGHQHDTLALRDECNSVSWDASSVAKMAQVDFLSPQKVRHHYLPGKREQRGALEVVIFTDEEIVPWVFEEPTEIL